METGLIFYLQLFLDVDSFALVAVGHGGQLAGSGCTGLIGLSWFVGFLDQTHNKKLVTQLCLLRHKFNFLIATLSDGSLCAINFTKHFQTPSQQDEL